MQKQFTITAQEGLHARPCTLLVTAATPFTSDIKISAGDRSGNLKSIMAVMSLGITVGATISISAEGSDAAEAIEKISTVITTEGIGVEA